MRQNKENKNIGFLHCPPPPSDLPDGGDDGGGGQAVLISEPAYEAHFYPYSFFFPEHSTVRLNLLN